MAGPISIPRRFQPVSYLGNVASGYSHMVHAKDMKAGFGEEQFVAILITPMALATTTYIENQVRIHRGVRHPNIIPFREAMSTQAHFLIVHSYPRGAMTLHKFVEKRRSETPDS